MKVYRYFTKSKSTKLAGFLKGRAEGVINEVIPGQSTKLVNIIPSRRQ